MYVNAETTDVEIRNLARRISYGIGINLGEFAVQYLALERHVLQLEASVADMEALRSRLLKLESGQPPHMARVERRDRVTA
jgi:hypothetical protein